MESKKMTFGRAMKWLLAMLLIGAVVGGAFGFGYTMSKNQNLRQPSQGSLYSLADNGYTGSSGQELLSNPLVSGKVIEASTKAQNAVVVIITKAQQQVQTIFGQNYVKEYSALGSGVIFKEEDGKLYILTNAHVIEEAKEAYLYFDEENMVNVYLVGESVSNDLAVVYVNKADIPEELLQNLSVATLGDSSKVRKGDLAIAIGSPFGKQLAHTTTVGIVTGVDQEFEIDGKTLNVVQTDAALNPGNSGGALINENGEVIGINSAGIRDGKVEGMGFAISINKAKEVIDTIFEKGTVEKASMGIESATFIDEEGAKLYRVPGGLFIYKLTSGGAAEKAGLRVGDVITSVNGIALTDENSLDDILAVLSGGDTVDVEIIRNRDARNVMTVSVTLDGISDASTDLPTKADSSAAA